MFVLGLLSEISFVYVVFWPISGVYYKLVCLDKALLYSIKSIKRVIIYIYYIYYLITIMFWDTVYKTQTKFTPSPTILSTSTDCPPCSLLSVRTSSPLSCSLLMYRLSVQRRKACLLRWRVSKKGRQPVRCPSLPLLQFSRQNNRSLSPCSVCLPSRRAPHTPVSCKVQITDSVVIHGYFGKKLLKVCSLETLHWECYIVI